MLGLRYVGRVDGIPAFVATSWGCAFWCPDNAATVIMGICVIYRSTQDLNDACTRRHELQHMLQAQELGRIRFWLLYRYYQRIAGHAGNPFEIDARCAADRTQQAMLDRLRRRGLLRTNEHRRA